MGRQKRFFFWAPTKISAPAEATGQTPEKIAEDTQRDFWLGTKDAIDYGLLGKVIHTADDLPK